jgi:hypothetical protein
MQREWGKGSSVTCEGKRLLWGWTVQQQKGILKGKNAMRALQTPYKMERCHKSKGKRGGGKEKKL